MHGRGYHAKEDQERTWATWGTQVLTRWLPGGYQGGCQGGGRVPHVLSVKVVANVSGSCEEWGWKLPTQGGLHVCACMGVLLSIHMVCVY